MLPKADIVYTCTALHGTGKRGELKKDEDGYYKVLAGALGYCNNAGDFYAEAPGIECILGESSSFQRKLRKGVLYGEAGHPRRDPSWSRDQWFARLLDIVEQNQSHHIRAVSLAKGMRDEKGIPFTGIMLDIRPTKNQHGEALEDNLNNRHANTYFSIRSFTNDVPAQGRWVKNMQMCITFDWVLEGGILPACKYSNPSLEQFNEEQETRTVFSSEDIVKGLDIMEEKGVSMEAAGIDRGTVLRELGMAYADYRKHPSLLF